MMKNKGRLTGTFGTLLVTAFLLSGCGGSAIYVGGVGIEPRLVTLSPGQTQVFTGSAVDVAVRGFNWGVIEGERGGTVTEIANSQETLSRPTAVTYTAPITKGTYPLRLGLNPQLYSDSPTEATIQVR